MDKHAIQSPQFSYLILVLHYNVVVYLQCMCIRLTYCGKIFIIIFIKHFFPSKKHTLYFNDSLILVFKQTTPNFCISPDKILFSDIEFYRITSKKARRTFKNGLGVPFTTLRIKSKPTVYSVVVFSK